MQIRTAIIVAGTALAVAAPSATAMRSFEAPSPPAHATFDSVAERSAFRWSTSIAPTTENSFGGRTSSATVNGTKLPRAKAKAKAKGTTYVVTVIIEPMLPPSAAATTAPDPNACQSSMTDCTDEQLCELWGENCDVWYAEQAAQARAANEQQPTDDQRTN